MPRPLYLDLLLLVTSLTASPVTSLPSSVCPLRQVIAGPISCRSIILQVVFNRSVACGESSVGTATRMRMERPDSAFPSHSVNIGLLCNGYHGSGASVTGGEVAGASS